MSDDSKNVPASTDAQRSFDYEVGYAKPPLKSRFKKGDPSPNPRGRPTNRSVTPDSIIDRVGKATVAGPAGVLITKHEALVRTLFLDAIKGDCKAAREILRIRHKYSKLPSTAPKERVQGLTVSVYNSPDPRLPLKEQEAHWRREQQAHGELEANLSNAPKVRRKRLTATQRLAESRRQTFDRVAAQTITMRLNGVKRRVSLEAALWEVLYAQHQGQ